MVEKQIYSYLGEAIRGGKYLSITYKNKKEEVTSYWIKVLDINANDEIIVDMFNITKDDPLRNKKIFISSIQSAEILKFSHYDVSEKLIRKIEEDESLQVFHFHRFDNRLLSYYLECYRVNQDPFLHKMHLIPNLDLNEFTHSNCYKLSDEQKKHIIKEVYRSNYPKNHNYELALCEFSIDIESRGKFVVAYRKLTFDPVEETLFIGNTTQFNANFYIQDVKYSLSYFSDISPNDFEKSYNENKFETIELLTQNFRSGEMPNTRPEIVVLGYRQVDITSAYDEITSLGASAESPLPLKAFFQHLSLLDRKNRKEPHIVLYDQKINIDQLRTIYNALKYPITYVQGPPGTGKTQTILNILVNCLTNNKTLLISSNNNTPIDGIKEKLDLGKYRNKEILIPILRLGNTKYVSKAIEQIKKFYEFETKDIPKENLLFKLKEKSKEKNRELQKRLNSYEERLDIEQNLGFIDNLISKGDGTYFLLEEEKNKLYERLKNIPVQTDTNVQGIYETIKDNHRLMQYFYFESLRYLKRLKNKEYSDLIDIIYLKEEEERIKEFNNWIGSDQNLKKLTRVFPIILTTNISSRRLGQHFKFDLLTIDEAGQCDIATSLIPISKCTNMVLIGDTNQLKPIVLFEESKNKRLMEQFGIEEVHDYFNNSILSAYKKIDNISRDILLSYHYRCGKKIINYSNMRFYESKLNLENIKSIGEVKLLDVKNVNHKSKNSQIEEASAVVNYIVENNLSDVFILTPFRNQEAVLNHYLNEAKSRGEIDHSVNCGTIHKVQGQENKTIIISTALSKETSPKTYDWVKDNSELINVGVTRAKENLIVVTDKSAIDALSRKNDDLYALIEYVEKNGTIRVPQSDANKFTIGFSNNSRFEDEFYTTMNHYCSMRGGVFKRNVKVTEVFPEEAENVNLNKKEFDGVLYKGNKPECVFEINGSEHYTRKKRIDSDRAKMELLKKKNIKLLNIPNRYVKHYEFIRELINKFNGEVYQKSLFD